MCTQKKATQLSSVQNLPSSQSLKVMQVMLDPAAARPGSQATSAATPASANRVAIQPKRANRCRCPDTARRAVRIALARRRK